MIGTATLFARSVAAVCLYRQDMVLGRFNVSRHEMACALPHGWLCGWLYDDGGGGVGGGSDGSDVGGFGGVGCSVSAVLGIDTASLHDDTARTVFDSISRFDTPKLSFSVDVSNTGMAGDGEGQNMFVILIYRNFRYFC